MSEAGRPSPERIERRLERERQARLEAEVIAETATRRLYEASELKSLFIANVSHELRTPLAAICGFVGLLRETGDHDRDRIIDALERNADALRTLIEQLLDFTHLEVAGTELAPHLKLEPLPLGEIVQATVHEVSTGFTANRFHLDVDLEAMALADRTAIRRIIVNLFDNASKYSPKGSTIRVSVAHTGDQAMLRVDDEGPGVAPEERERIFDRFYRTPSALALRTRGLGIGLSVVRALARGMGGDANVISGPAGGARFEIALKRPRSSD